MKYIHTELLTTMKEKPTKDLDSDRNRRMEIIGLALFTILFLAINAMRIFNDSISGDEGFSIMLARQSIPDMIHSTAIDVHPPLYYLIFQLFGIVMGTSAIAARVVTFVAIILTMLLANTYIRKQFGVYTAAFFVSLLTFNITGIEMIVEARMYTWAMLFVTLTAIFGYELLRQQKFWKWLGFLVFALAAGYTHYYALIMVAFIYITVFAILILYNKKNLLPCFLCGIAAVIGYLPWLFILLQQLGTVSADYWINSVELKEWIRYIFGHDRFGKLLRIILVISGFLYLFTKDGLTITHNLARMRGNKEKDTKPYMNFTWDKVPKEKFNDRFLVLICGITVVGTLGVATVVSYLIRPLYVERYLYSGYGLIALAFGIAFTNVSKKKIYSWLLIAAIILVGASSFKSIVKTEKAYMTEDTKAFFAENLEAGDVFVTDNRQLCWTVLNYYYPEVENYYVTLFDAYKEDYHTIWYFAEKPEIHERVKEYEANGLTVTHVGDSGIGRYPYYLYKITK